MPYVTAADLTGKATGSRRPRRRPRRRRQKSWAIPMSSYMTPGERGDRGDVPPVGKGLGNPVTDVFRDIAVAVGARDPITHYEPGMPLPDVFKKYSAQVDAYQKEVPRLRSASAQPALLAQLQPLEVLRNRIAPAFRGGGTPGERDRDRLAELVQGMRNFRKDWHDAKARYGLNHAVKLSLPGTPSPDPAPKKGNKAWLWLAALPFFFR